MSEQLGEKFIAWAARQSAIALVVLIGSRARTGTRVAPADEHSDWDFQLATSHPELFENREWAMQLGLIPLAYVFRGGRLGNVRRATAVFAQGELDLVVLPVERWRTMARTVSAGRDSDDPTLLRGFWDLAAVVQGGHKILKGEAEFGAFYAHAAQTVTPTRLTDDAALKVAEGFVCDYVSTRRKLARGENVAAQRWLHLHLVEANLQLLHELRLREGKHSFHDARRLETLQDSRADALSISARLEAAELSAAVASAAESCRSLMRALVGDAWRWPDGVR